MRCTQCNREIPKQSRFCSYCGAKVEYIEEMTVSEKKNLKTCPGCKKTFDSSHVYCDQCGRFLLEKIIEGKVLKRFKMISLHDGAPMVGVAKATGDLIIYEDRIRLEIKMGNSAGAVFGVIGMAMAASKAKKEAPEGEIYWMKDIEAVQEGRYMGAMPSIVMQMRDNRIFKFTGFLNAAEVARTVELINEYRLLN